MINCVDISSVAPDDDSLLSQHPMVGHTRGRGRSSKRTNVAVGQSLTSNYIGVHWHKSAARWFAYISISSKRTHLGYFKTEQEAAFRYDEAARALYRPTNFPFVKPSSSSPPVASELPTSPRSQKRTRKDIRDIPDDEGISITAASSFGALGGQIRANARADAAALFRACSKIHERQHQIMSALATFFEESAPKVL